MFSRLYYFVSFVFLTIYRICIQFNAHTFHSIAYTSVYFVVVVVVVVYDNEKNKAGKQWKKSRFYFHR